MIDALKSITNYEALGVIESFKGTCFGHEFSKACQHSHFKTLVTFHLQVIGCENINLPHTYDHDCKKTHL
jgi:hypothetical protein